MEETQDKAEEKNHEEKEKLEKAVVKQAQVLETTVKAQGEIKEEEKKEIKETKISTKGKTLEKKDEDIKDAKPKEPEIDSKPKEEIKKEGKKETSVAKKPEKVKPKKSAVVKKKDEAVAKGQDLRVSKKQSVYICRFIINKTVDEAIRDLQAVARLKKAVPFKGEIPHRKGKGMMSGRYPVKAALAFVTVLKGLKGNLMVNGLDVDKSPIYYASASWASRPARPGHKRAKRTNIILKAKEKEAKH